MGNKKPYIEGQTIQWTKDKQWPTKDYTDWATLILQKGDEPRDSKQFLLHWGHPSCYSCYKTGEKSWMKKGPNCDLHNTFPESNHMMYTGVHISNEGIYDNVGDKSSNRINLTSFLHHINVKNK
jgi:hypothetical protein